MDVARIVVIGGGFAGTQAVRSLLRRLPTAHIKLIDADGHATMVPALPDALSGRVRREMLQRSLDELFGTSARGRVSIVTDRVRYVALDERRVYGEELYDYDGLIVAPGSVPTTPPTELQPSAQAQPSAELPGAVSPVPVHTLHSFESAERFRAAVQALLDSAAAATPNAPVQSAELGGRSPAGPAVVIVGAGYTGLEVALALRDGFGPDRPAGQGTTPLRITVVEAGADILPMARERERRRVYEYLGARGIELKLGTTLDGAVQSADGPGVRLSDGTEIPRALVCWSAGMRAVGIGLQEQLPHTRDGRIHTNEYLQAPGHPEVMIAGDAAALQRDGELVRRAVNFAYYSGRRAGRNLAAYLSNQASGSMKPFQPVDLGWIIPLGDASIGRLLGTIPVGGRFASRLHYIMSGFRHFGGGRAGEFYRTAVHLRRRPDPVYAAAATRSRPAAERSSPARVGDEA